MALKKYKDGQTLFADDLNQIIDTVNESTEHIDEVVIATNQVLEVVDEISKDYVTHDELIKIVNLTQEEYDNLTSYDDNTIYLIKD